MEYALFTAPLVHDLFVFFGSEAFFLHVFVFLFFVLDFLKSPTFGLVAKHFLACSSQFIQSLL